MIYAQCTCKGDETLIGFKLEFRPIQKKERDTERKKQERKKQLTEIFIKKLKLC